MEKIFFRSFSNIDEMSYQLKDKVIFITGASGLIGKMVIHGVCYLNKKHELNIKVIALVRNKEKIEKIFKYEIEKGIVKVLVGDVGEQFTILETVDFIIHAASITQSKIFIEQPVEVTRTNIIGTLNVLELARKNPKCKMVYLSSMEVYGFNKEEKILSEENLQYLNSLSVRNCYPESKRMAENLCISYSEEYEVDVKIIRLAQIFGFGVEKEETRVFAQFVRSLLEQKDIMLVTKGESKRMYLDTIDAVSAIFTVLLFGKKGEAYNAANKETYCSIKEMADLVAHKIGKDSINVKIQENDIDSKKYPPEHNLLLNIDKIEALGWKAFVGLEEMFQRIISEWSLK